MKIDYNSELYNLPEENIIKKSFTRLIEEEATKRLYSNLHSKFDELFIEGLKRKGFEFDNLIETEEFVKHRCICEDNTLKSERIFYVDEVPFFLHRYKTEVEIPALDENRIYISATIGTYSFL